MQKSITIGKGKLNYALCGEGRPLLFIHGFAEDGEIWKNQVAHFGKNYQLIIVDLAGSGQSDFQSEIFSMTDHADTISKVMETENIASATIIGHSMGGYIALAFAEKYPEKLHALCLFHSSSAADTEEKKQSRQKSIEFIEKNGSAKFIQQTTPNLFSDKTQQESPELVKEILARYSNFNPESLVHYYEAMIQRPDRSEVLRKIAKPVLIIAGEHDQAIPVKLSREQSVLPELCYFHSLKNSGHMGMIEEPGNSNSFLETFFEET